MTLSIFDRIRRKPKFDFDLEPGWEITSQGGQEDPGDLTFHSPEGWAFSSIKRDESGEVVDYVARAPDGQSFRKADLESRMARTSAKVEILPRPVTPAPRIAPQITPSLPVPGLPVAPSPEIAEAIKKVYPRGFGREVVEGEETDLIKQVTEKPEEFLADLRLKGETPETVKLLQSFSDEPLDKDTISSFFSAPPEDTLFSKALPNIARGFNLEWAKKNVLGKPDVLRKSLITEGRNENTEALIRQLFPNISERGLRDYFQKDMRAFDKGLKSPVSRPRAMITTPKGNKIPYPMTDREWNSMTPAERVFYEAKPDEWAKERNKWAQLRVATDRIKIVAETLGITPSALDSPSEQWRLAYETALLLPILDIGQVGKAGYGLLKKATPKNAQEFLKGIEDVVSKIAKTDIGELADKLRVRFGERADDVATTLKQNADEALENLKKEPERGAIKFSGEDDIDSINLADEQLKFSQDEAIKAGGSITQTGERTYQATNPKGLARTFTDSDSALEFVRGEKAFVPKAAVKLTPETGTDIAKQMDVRFDGIQKGIGDIPDSYLFTDKQTGSTFAANSLDEAQKRLAEMRGQFAAKPRPVTGEKTPAPRAANIRLDKFNEDVRPVIKEWADTHPQEVETARRGVRSDAQVRLEAERLMSEVGGDLDKLRAEWKPGTAWNAEEITALRGILADKTKSVLEATKLAKAGDAESLLRLQLALHEQAAVQETVHGITAEAGRALRSFRQSFNEAGSDVQKMEALLKMVGGKANTEKVAELLSKLDINDPVAVNAFIRNLNKPKLMDYVNELYYFSVLSGPKSWIVNALSTALNTAYSPLRRLGAAVVEVPLSAVQGRARERFFGEAPADAIGAWLGAKQGFQQFAHVIKNGVSIEQATKWEIKPKAFGNKTSAVLGFGPRIMEATDQMMMAWNMRAATNAEAYRMASLSKLKGKPLMSRMADILSDPPVELLARAKATAERNLFRDEPGQFAKWLMSGRDKISYHGIEPLRFVFPFVKTPVNLAKFGLENSPVGFFNPKILANLRAKNPQAAEQVAEAILGTMGLAGVAAYAAEGKITGSPPRNAAERERFYREGKQPFAIRVGDIWISYQKLEPFNQIFTQASLIVDAIQNEDKNVQELITNAATTFARNFISQGYMSGISDAIDAVEEPERYGNNWLNRFAGAGVPWSAALRTAAQIADPMIRAPENVIDSIKSNIPGLSKNVQAKITSMGEEVKRKSPAWFPVSVTPVEETILSKELERLKYDIGFAGTSIDGFKLSPEEQTRYQTIAGQNIKTDLEKLMLAPDYWQADDSQREKMIRKVTDTARERARAKMKEKMFSTGPVEERINTITTAVKTADSQLGKVISATPEFSHEPPNVYDLAHELDSSYRSLLNGIPEVKDAPPTVKSWYEKEKQKVAIAPLPNRSLSSLNADPKEGDTFEDYFNQWQQRQLLDEKELAEFDKAHPNAQYGNFSRRQLEDLRKFHSLTGVEQRDFLNRTPSLTANPKKDWLTSHPRENALLALWGEERLLTKESLDAYNKLVQELDIVDSALPDVIPENLQVFNLTTEKTFRETTAKIEAARQLTDEKLKDEEIEKLRQTKIGEFTYKDIERKVEALQKDATDAQVDAWVQRGQIADQFSPNSAEAKLWLVDNPDSHKWALENGLLTDDGKDWNIPVLRINSQYREQDKAYDALPTEGTARADYLKNDPIYADARIRRDGYEMGFDEVMVGKWSEFRHLPGYGFWEEHYLQDNPGVLEAIRKGMKDPHWMEVDLSKDIPSPAYDEIYEKYKDLFDQYEDAKGTDAERTAFRKNLFDQNPAFKEAHYARAAYGLLLPEKNVQDYVTYMLMSEKGWAKERYLATHREFYDIIKVKKEWTTDIKWDEIPTEAVEAKFFEYENIPTQLAKQRQDYRAANPDLDDWLVLTKRVSKSIKEIKRRQKLSPREEFYEDLFEKQSEFEKSIEELRKKLGGL